MILFRCIAITLLVFLMASCGRKSETEGAGSAARTEAVLAQVGKERITLSEFQAEIQQRSHGFPDAFQLPEQRAALLEEMIRRKAAWVRARAEGADRDPATRALVEQLIASRFIERGLAKESIAEPSVSDAAIEMFYHTNAAAYQTPATTRAGVIWLKVGSKAEAAKRAEMRERAVVLREEASRADAAGFAQLVQQHSEDQATRYIGGDTGWLEEGKSSPHWPDEVVQTTFTLKRAGEVAPLVETAVGFFVVRLSERREATVRPLAEVRDVIRHELLRKAQLEREQAFFGELKRGLNIYINQEMFDTLPPPSATTTAAVPSLPGS